MSGTNRDAPQGREAESLASPGLWALVREDWRSNGRDWSLPGFRALAVYRLGVWRMGIRRRIFRLPFSLVYRHLFRFVRNHYGIELPYTATIGRRVMIAHQGTIVFHENTVVGDDCIIRHGVTLGAASHRRSHEAPVLGNGVQVGAGAMVLGAIHVGDGAAIGANAVVTCDVPAYARAVIEPARIIPGRPRGPSMQRDEQECEAAPLRFDSLPLPMLALLLTGQWISQQWLSGSSAACCI